MSRLSRSGFHAGRGRKRNVAGAMAGILLGGFISGPLFARDQRWALWMAAAAYIAAFPVLLLAIFTSSYAVAMGCLFFGFAILTCAYGPIYALVQNVMRPDMRAFAISLTFLATNLIGEIGRTSCRKSVV